MFHDCWLLIGNPNNSEATAWVTYMIEGEGEGAEVFVKKIPANSRKSYNMANDIGVADASIKVDSDIPVIPERAMYRNNRREGHVSIGTTLPSQDYYLAEGTTDWGFTSYILIQNPNEEEARVSVIYLTPSGPVVPEPFTIPPNSRHTIRMNDVLPGTESWTTFVPPDAPAGQEVNAIWGEQSGLMWFGTDQGVTRLSAAGWDGFEEAEGAYVTTVWSGKPADLWFGTDDEGVLRNRSNRWQAFTTADGLPSDRVLDV